MDAQLVEMLSLMTVMIIPVVLALAALQSQSTVADPLAPSRDGWLSCVQPNREARTCESIYRYRWVGRKIFYDVDVLFRSEPETVLRMRSQMYSRDDAVCSLTFDAESGVIGMSIDGHEADGEALAQARREVAELLKDTDGLEYCVRYTPATDGQFTYWATVAGVPRSEPEGVMMWVRSDDGWTVAP